MDSEMKQKMDLYEKELDKLISDFSAKKKTYFAKYIKLSWSIAVVNACVSFSLGISFIEKVAVQFKVVALFFSSVLLVLNGAMGFLNYKNMYEQRTKTLVRLLALRRETRLSVVQEMTEDDLKKLCSKLETIMQDDLSQWLDNIPKDNT